jgi:hypothetical protein
MTENINIQANDGQQFAKDDHDNKTVYGYKKKKLQVSEIIATNY